MIFNFSRKLIVYLSDVYILRADSKAITEKR